MYICHNCGRCHMPTHSDGLDSVHFRLGAYFQTKAFTQQLQLDEMIVYSTVIFVVFLLRECSTITLIGLATVTEFVRWIRIKIMSQTNCYAPIELYYTWADEDAKRSETTIETDSHESNWAFPYHHHTFVSDAKS